MLQNFGTPITDDTKDAREALRLALGLDKNVPFADYINYIPSQYNPLEIFSAGQQGFWYEPSDITTLSQDSDGLVPVTSNNDPIGRVKDKSGNGNDAVQSISARRMMYKVSPPRLSLDNVDDEFVIRIPVGGWIGTMVIATNRGTASYQVKLPAGNYLLGGKYFPSNEVVGVLFRNGILNDNEKEAVEKYFVSKGAVESFINTTNLTYLWRNFKSLTEFPLINTSSAATLTMAWTDCSLLESFPLIDTSKASGFYFTWSGCTSLTSFPQIDTSNASDFAYGWNGCASLTSFPLLNTSKVSRFFWAWGSCRSLTYFPANFFDDAKGGDFSFAFMSTNLNQESIDGILTSLVTSGIASGTRRFDQSGGSSPSEIGRAAIDTLRSRGWTVNVTGGY